MNTTDQAAENDTVLSAAELELRVQEALEQRQRAERLFQADETLDYGYDDSDD